MRIKDIIVLWALLQIILLPNAVFALETEDSHRSYCGHMGDNLKFDIQVHPELNGVYVSFYNPNDEDLNDISFNIFISENDSNKIVSNISVNVPVLHKNQIFCHLFEGINYSYNKDLSLFFWNLTYKLGELESAQYYSTKVDDVFRINKCIDVNNWDRVEEIKQNGDVEISEKIVFKKICPRSYKLNLDLKKLGVFNIQVKEAKIFYGNVRKELFIDSVGSSISLHLGDDIPLKETITINLKYEPFFSSERGKWRGNKLFYPFSTSVYEFNTGNIIPEEAYLTFEGGNIQNITDVGAYSVVIKLPKEFNYTGKASELEYSEDCKEECIIRDPNPPGIVHPSFYCLNVSSVPMDCLVAKVVLTKKEESNYKLITWESPIINGQPEKLSFDITKQVPNEADRNSLILYFVVFGSLLGVVLFITLLHKDWYIPAIVGCVTIWFSFKSFLLPIPPLSFTLFDLFATITIILISIISYKNRVKMEKDGEKKHRAKEKPRIVEIMKVVLHPLTEKLESNIAMLNRNEFGYDHTGVKSIGMKELELSFGRGFEENVYKSFKEECPEYTEKINDHDSKVGELRNAIIKSAEMIYTPAFEKKCIKLVKNYNTGLPTLTGNLIIRRRKIKKNNNEIHSKRVPKNLIDNSPIYLIRYIIDGNPKLEVNYDYQDFWKKYGVELLKIRENPNVKKQIEKVEAKSKELVETSEELKNEIESLIKQYEKEYGICKGDYMK